MSRRSTWLHAGLALATLLTLLLKLWTVEAWEADDLTARLLLKRAPSWTSHIVAGREQQNALASRVLLASENGFPGDNLYRFLVGWGWFVLPLVWAGVAAWPRIRRFAPRCLADRPWHLSVLTIMVWASGLLSLGTLGWLVFSVATHDANHVAWDPWRLYPVFVGSLAVAVVRAVVVRRLTRISWLLLLLAIAGVLSLAAVDRFNVLVEYEEWLKRGLPDRPF
jgi:hypothetical protein